MIFKLKKLYHIVSDRFFISALIKGAAAGVEHVKVLRTLGEIRHVVDIGANRGQFALAARRCFPSARILSFEPLSEPRKIFASVFQRDDNVRMYPFAIGPQSGQAIIHVSERDDSSSLLPIGSAQTSLFPETAEKETRVIEISSLDRFYTDGEHVDSPALLKIDVQGFELAALNGCHSLLHSFKYCYIECSFVELYTGQSLASDVIAHLLEENFSLIGVHNIYYDKLGNAIQADLLFHKLMQADHGE